MQHELLCLHEPWFDEPLFWFDILRDLVAFVLEKGVVVQYIVQFSLPGFPDHHSYNLIDFLRVLARMAKSVIHVGFKEPACIYQVICFD